MCSTPEGVIVGVTRVFGRRKPRCAKCSTPEGVIVGVTRPSTARRGSSTRSAQRPRASSSGSPRGTSASRGRSRRAQRPRASSSGSQGDRPRRQGDVFVLNARGRHRRGHIVLRYQELAADLCSTPEGVIVGVTRFRPGPSAGPRCAQRPRASSSGSPRDHHRHARIRWVLNARGRHRRGHRPIVNPFQQTLRGQPFQGPVDRGAGRAPFARIGPADATEVMMGAAIREIQPSSGLPKIRKSAPEKSLVAGGP